MSAELIKQKLDIAKRAGELHKELSELFRVKKAIEDKKKVMYHGGGNYANTPITVILDNRDVFSTRDWEPQDSTLHDFVLQYIETLISKREAEVNDLIKILQ